MSNNVKHVNVSVDSSGAISCSPDPANLSGSNVLVVFRLDTPGYAFPENNAVVVSNPGSQFPYPSWTAYPGYAVLFDLDGDDNSYSYTVSVVDLSTGRTLSVDPTIKNGHG